MEDRNLYFVGPDAVRIVTEQAQACPNCRTARIFFVNRGGRTMCAVCDGARQERAAKQKESVAC